MDIAEQIECLKTEVAVVRDALRDAQAELARTKRILSHPEYADAAASGTKNPAWPGLSEPNLCEAYGTRAEALAAYKKIEGAAEREAFRLQHKEILGL